MFCAISGEPPQEPVVSKKSGQLYERRLILKYIAESGTDPITGQPLAEDDLVELKASPKTAAPRPPTLSSVPALLVSLQNEYDAVVLEAFTLKKQYDAIRQELTHLLYQNDAANRVIARLMGERNQAREALANIQASLGAGAIPSLPPTGDTDMADAPGASSSAQGVPADVAALLAQTAERLSSQRRAKSKRKAPEGYPTPAALQESFEQLESVPSLHSTKPQGITALNLSPASTGVALALTGGNDKVVQVFDRKTGKVSATLKGHTKKVTAVAWTHDGEVQLGPSAAEGGANPTFPTHAVSASEDGTVRVWAHAGDGTGNYTASHVLQVSPNAAAAAASSSSKSKAAVAAAAGAAVVGVAVHPCGSLVGAATRDGHWALFDLHSGHLVLRVGPADNEDEEGAAGGYEYASFAFHPDGGLLAAGTAGGVVGVWNVSTGVQASTLRPELGGGAPITALSFSENGYFLAVGSAAASSVEVWDLRKVSRAATIPHAAGESGGGAGAGAGASGGGIQAVAFDPSAQFLAVVGPDVRVFANKSWALLAGWEENADTITCADWDAALGRLVVGGLDRTLRVFGPKGPAE